MVNPKRNAGIDRYRNIPFQWPNRNGCRNGIYNIAMNTQKEFEVGVLLENEAKNLFEKIVVSLTKTHEIQDTMKEIIKECGGLPIAITTVANALKN